MGHNVVGNIDSEVVAGITFAPLRHEREIPGATKGGSRVRGRGDEADGCNHPERRRLHFDTSPSCQAAASQQMQQFLVRHSNQAPARLGYQTMILL